MVSYIERQRGRSGQFRSIGQPALALVTHQNLSVFGHERAKEGLEVGAPGGQDRLVSVDERAVAVELDAQVGELVAHVFLDEVLQVLLEAGHLVDGLLVHGRLARRLPQTNDLDNQRPLELLELGEHDHLVEVGIFGKELHAQVLKQTSQQTLLVASHTGFSSAAVYFENAEIVHVHVAKQVEHVSAGDGQFEEILANSFQLGNHELKETEIEDFVLEPKNSKKKQT